MKRTSPHYQFTVDLVTGRGMSDVQELKKNISKNYRICLKGRLGPNNPNAYKYKKSKDYATIKLEDARYADVYVYSK